MERLVEYLPPEEAAQRGARLGRELGAEEVAVVRNLGYVFRPREFYPLAPHIRPPLERITAFAVDMDGTSTTTEPLALHALEYMVRRFTGRMSRDEWPGLDEREDYPYVIGNSNYRHTEFLVRRYQDRYQPEALRQAFFEALVWTLANMPDTQRRRDIRLNAENCGLSALLRDGGFLRSVDAPIPDEDATKVASGFVGRFGDGFVCDTPSKLVSAALDVYYMRYHAILRRVEAGEGADLSHELLGEEGRRLVEPMRGYAEFAAIIKGWLGESAGLLAERLGDPSAASRLAALGGRFADAPAKLALVTASISYEAHAVMREVLRVMAEEVDSWPVPTDVRTRVREHFDDYHHVFDGFITATDSSEARLKPHPDLYSIALYQMSVPREAYSSCVGIEDTEPGIVSLRAAGIGCAVALPNRDTNLQNYHAATTIIKRGLPDLILNHNLLSPQ